MTRLLSAVMILLTGCAARDYGRDFLTGYLAVSGGNPPYVYVIPKEAAAEVTESASQVPENAQRVRTDGRRYSMRVGNYFVYGQCGDALLRDEVFVDFNPSPMSISFDCEEIAGVTEQ